MSPDDVRARIISAAANPACFDVASMARELAGEPAPGPARWADVAGRHCWSSNGQEQLRRIERHNPEQLTIM